MGAGCAMYGSIYGGPWGDTPNHPSHERREDAVPVEQFPKSPQILPMATAHSDVSKNVSLFIGLV